VRLRTIWSLELESKERVADDRSLMYFTAAPNVPTQRFFRCR